jgi:hypothetical protein
MVFVGLKKQVLYAVCFMPAACVDTPVQNARTVEVVAQANIAVIRTKRMAPGPAQNTWAVGKAAPASEVVVKKPAVSVTEPGAEEQMEVVAEAMTTMAGRTRIRETG